VTFDRKFCTLIAISALFLGLGAGGHLTSALYAEEFKVYAINSGFVILSSMFMLIATFYQSNLKKKDG